MSQKGTALARSLAHRSVDRPTEAEWVNDDEDADIIIAVRANPRWTTEIEQCSGRKGEGRIGLGGAVTAIISEALFGICATQQPPLAPHFAVPSVGRRPYPAKAEPKLQVSDGRAGGQAAD